MRCCQTSDIFIRSCVFMVDLSLSFGARPSVDFQMGEFPQSDTTSEIVDVAVGEVSIYDTCFDRGGKIALWFGQDPFFFTFFFERLKGATFANAKEASA